MVQPIALQLYTVRDALTKDFDGTIRQIAAMGYLGVETATFPGTTPQAAAKLFDSLGLQVVGAHLSPPIGDNKNQVLDTIGALGCNRLIVPYTPDETWKTVDGIKQVCDMLNEADAAARENGLTLLYHNHWWEYGSVDGRIAHDIFLEHAAPTIQLEVDTYWVQTAGQDAAAVLDSLGSRAALAHIKDGPCLIEASMTAVGSGSMNWHKVIPAAAAAEWLIVELDRCDSDMLQAVEQSIIYLTQEGLGRGKG